MEQLLCTKEMSGMPPSLRIPQHVSYGSCATSILMPVRRAGGTFQWDEKNLQANEELKAEMGPRMKIDEPDTPYHPSFDVEESELPPDLALGAASHEVELRTPPELCVEGTKVKAMAMNVEHVS